MWTSLFTARIRTYCANRDVSTNMGENKEWKRFSIAMVQ